ncbi:hypothetical protein [Labrenzia sp. OB1]|uniref:hypothetical protein n=1 Tax=Labrenzia sp. OB1 TaxID=1561204 RepID=UPI0012E91B41|nr:hypothetical protein [Labrenzia sp. OB1]
MAGISAGLSLVGGATQAQGIRAEAEATAQAEETRAELAERQKAVNQTQASYERRRTLGRLQRVQGQVRAAGAENGLAETGSLVDVLEANDLEAAEDLEATRFRSEGERDTLTYEAGAARRRASTSRQSGRTGAAGAILGGISGGVTTLGTAYSRYSAQN